MEESLIPKLENSGNLVKIKMEPDVELKPSLNQIPPVPVPDLKYIERRILKVSVERLSDIEIERYILRAKLRALKHSKLEHLCGKCGAAYDTDGELKGHPCPNYKKLEDGKWMCGICRKAISKKRDVINHVRVHTGEKPFACDICKSKFKDKRNLRIHERIHTDTRPFQCPTCCQSFISSSALIAHRKIHDGPKFRCTFPECTKAFYTKVQLNYHESNHKGEKFICTICQRGFSLANKNRHERRCAKRFNQDAEYIKLYDSILSTKEKLEGIICKACLIGFKSELELTEHVSVGVCVGYAQVVEPNIFRCGICSKIKRYTVLEMNNHVKYHTASKKFKCQHCSKTYRYKSEMLRHEQLHENNSTKNFVCEICGTSYTNLYRFNVHRKKKHTKGVSKEVEDLGIEGKKVNRTTNSNRKKKVKLKLEAPEKETSKISETKVYQFPVINLPVTLNPHGEMTELDHNASPQMLHYQVTLSPIDQISSIEPNHRQDQIPIELAPEHRYIMIQTQDNESTYFHIEFPLPSKNSNEQKGKQDTEVLIANNFLSCEMVEETASPKYDEPDPDDDFGIIDPWEEFFNSEQITKKKERRPMIDKSGLFSKVKPDEWKCSVCPKVTRRRLEMVSHSRVHTGEKPFKCNLCAHSFKDNRDLKIHIRSHTGETPYTCPLCSMTFRHNAPFNAHKRSHGKAYEEYVKQVTTEISRSLSEKSSSFKTDSTKKTTDNYGNSATALLASSFEYKCTICFLGFNSEQELTSHDCRNYGPTDDRKWKCGFCGKIAIKRLEMAAHTRVHTGERPFNCPNCSKKYRDQRSLKRHEAISHLGKSKQFTCNLCSKCFTTKYNRDIHERKHRSEKPFLCSTCGMDFFDKQNYRYHIIRHEIGGTNNIFTCQFCNTDLTTKHELFQHYHSLHPGKMKKRKKIKLSCT